MSDDLAKKAMRAFEAGPQYVPMNDFRLMCEEVLRLRALVRGAESAGDSSGMPACPWCNACRSIGEYSRSHAADCPAFTPDGEVQ